MSKLITIAAALMLIGGGCTGTAKNAFDTELLEVNTATDAYEETRADQLELEGLINDYCYRHNVRGEFTSVRCYANVSIKDIIVYIYPIEGGGGAFAQRYEMLQLSEQLPGHITDQFLSSDDWAWAKDYTIMVVDRVTK